MLNSFIVPSTVKENGVRLGDTFVIDVFQKGKRTLILNRTKFLIRDAPDFQMDYQTSQMGLPTFNNERIDCEIVFLKEQEKDDESEGRFMIISRSRFPIRVNGNWVFKAFIERGDSIDIGFNKFRFEKKFEEEIAVDQSIPKELIQSKISLMIEGETGTGKTRMAKLVHDDSGVSGSFVHLNLSSFSQGIIESELFGHVKGAFTGAVNDKKGAILEAHKGTLFLDEIDSLSLELQTKLLLFLESHEFRPVGGERVLKSDARIIFASGRSLHQLVIEQKMRKDFYFRLISGHLIKLKSLRDDRDKILEICEAFEREEYVIISDELKKFYLNLPWPGNIRQLISQLRKKKVLANGRKIIFDRHDQLLLDENNIVEKNTGKLLSLEEVKINHCMKVFNSLGQNYKATSRALSISPNTLKSLLGKEVA